MFDASNSNGKPLGRFSVRRTNGLLTPQAARRSPEDFRRRLRALGCAIGTWYTYNKLLNMTIEIVDLPKKNQRVKNHLKPGKILKTGMYLS